MTRGIPLPSTNLVEPLVFEQCIDDPTHVTAQRPNRLVMGFSCLAFLLIVLLRLRHGAAMPIDGRHHGGLGSCVDLLRRLGAVSCARTVIQGSHAEIQRQTAFLLEARHRPDLTRELRGADRAKPR